MTILEEFEQAKQLTQEFFGVSVYEYKTARNCMCYYLYHNGKHEFTQKILSLYFNLHRSSLSSAIANIEVGLNMRKGTMHHTMSNYIAYMNNKLNKFE